MNPYLEITIVIAVYIGHALRVIIGWILYPFKPVWYLVYVLLLPFIHLGLAIWTLVSYPARLFPGSLVETMYIYLSTAVLIGLFSGAILMLVQQVSTSVLKLDQPQASAVTPKRTMADHRARRKERKEAIKNTSLTDVDDLGYVSPKSAGVSPGHISPLASPTMTDSQLKWARRSLIASPSIILEEGSSDDYF